MSSDDVRIGKRVREARMDAKIKQGELADRLGISRPAISQWENGRSDPTHENLVQIAAITGKPLSWFHIKSDEEAMKLANSAVADAMLRLYLLLPAPGRLHIDREILRASVFFAPIASLMMNMEIPSGQKLEALLDRIKVDIDATHRSPR